MTVSESDIERLFLQAIMSRGGIVTLQLAQTLWKKAAAAVRACDATLGHIPTGDTAQRVAWEDFSKKISDNVDKVDLEFRSISDEATGQRLYLLVNRKEDELSQLATDYTPAEITLFRAIVERIMTAPRDSFSIWSTDALAEIAANKLSLTQSQGEILLTSFVTRGWLRASSSKKGLYTLSTRAVVELSPYLRVHYEDELLTCRVCTEILTRGVACPGCNVKMHLHCFTNTFKKSANNTRRVCPSCNTNWPAEPVTPLRPIGEEAAREKEGRRRGTRTSRFATESEEEAEESQGEGTQEATQTQTQTQTQQRRSTSKRTKTARFQPDESTNSMYVDDEAEDDNFGEDDDDVEEGPSQLPSQRRSRR